MRRIIWWLRRDLRVTDNVALHHALHDSTGVIPVFFLDPRWLLSEELAPAGKQFLIESLADLGAQLHERGGRRVSYSSAAAFSRTRNRARIYRVPDRINRAH